MKLLVIAPHQDDEVLSSFLLMKKIIDNGGCVYVLYITNGDYRGFDYARRRYKEVCECAKMINIPLSNLIYMGYPDTGMSLNNSFLYNLYFKRESFKTPNAPKTYHPYDLKTVHMISHNTQATFDRSTFINDLSFIINKINPDTIITPSELDTHGDHKACALFIKEIIRKFDLKSSIYSYLIHSNNELEWPNRTGEYFLKPFEINDLFWDNRIIIQYNINMIPLKRKAISAFKSQVPSKDNSFLLSFSKTQEIFFNEFIL